MELLRISRPSSEAMELIPKNLTRWHIGTRLLLPNASGGFDAFNFEQQTAVPEAAFLSDDETEGVELEAGVHDIIVDLGDFLSVSRFFCLSFGAGGDVRLRASEILEPLDSENWVPLGRTVPFQPDSAIDLRFPLADTRFLWVRFDIDQPGEMGGFGAMGLLSAAQVQLIGRPVNRGIGGSGADTVDGGGASGDGEIAGQSGSVAGESARREGIPYDFGKVYSGSSVAFLNSGDPRLANYLIDDDVLTYYEVPPSRDVPVFILRLSADSNVEKISLLLESGPGAMEVAFVDRLPFSDQDPPGTGQSARFWTRPGTNEVLLLAANNPALPDSLRYAQTSDFQTIEVDSGFFDNIPGSRRVAVSPGQTRVRIPVPRNSANYLILRWIPEGDVNLGLRIFEISVIGSVEPLERVVQYQAAPAASASEFAALELPENPGESPPIGSPPGEGPGNPPDIVVPNQPVVSP